MDDREDMDVATDGSRVQRACDSCRNRKIRCDRGTPCSNCRASKLNCQTTAPTLKVQRQRVHISDEYERKIDRIEDRLAGIENVLENLANKLSNLDVHKDYAEQSSQSKSSRAGKSSHSSSDVHSSTPAPFEGESALNAQSEIARELLEKAVGNTPSMGQNTEIQAALATLQSMVSRQNHVTMTSNERQPLFNKPLAELDASQLERPPWEAVVDVLEKATIYPAVCFAIIFPFLKLNKINNVLKETYDSPREASTGRRILVYGVLYHLFTEFASYPYLGRRVERFKSYATQCRTQMETGISQLDLLLPASYENILALLLAASYAVELCKPSLCWVLNSTAISLCQHLGYHRISSMKDDTNEDRAAKLHIFWYLYVIDKTLSLRLGRSSAIQDWDMSLPYPIAGEATSSDPRVPERTDLQIHWIKVATLQGQTYERLFSPAAFLKSDDERSHIANELVDALNQAWSERAGSTVLDLTFMGSKHRSAGSGTSSNPDDLHFPGPGHVSYENNLKVLRNREGVPSLGEVDDLFYLADEVVLYSTVTLIHRARSREDGIFSRACLESARAALIAHQKASQQFNVKGNEDLWSGYLSWSVLQAPFTPFIVIFCHVISTCSKFDLNTLSDFVLTLESSRTLSEAADKLYKMCHLFLSVAKLYVEAKTQESAEDARMSAAQNNGYNTLDGEQLDPSSVNQFDPFLSALGLVPNSAWPMASFQPTQPGLENYQGMDSAGGNQNPIQDWFSGSRYIMGLMEDDIIMPDLNL